MNKQFSTNLYGAMAVTRAVLPHMRAKQHGTLVFMGSQSGWRGDPSISAYAASKFALEGPYPSPPAYLEVLSSIAFVSA